MRLLSWLRYRLERYSIPNLAMWIIAGQVLLYGVGLANPEFIGEIVLIPNNVLGGEYWRLLTFVFEPSLQHPLFLFFALYFFYMMGTVLEHDWGSFRFNAFLLVGYIATVSSSFLIPNMSVSNAFIGSSVFLAFARLYPNYTIYILFVLPVRIRWVATLTWLAIAWVVLFTPSWALRLHAVAGVANYLLFFGREIVTGARASERQMRRQVARITKTHSPTVTHKCVVCGLTDADDPEMEFRYCSKCNTSPCYCSNHIQAHEHQLSITKQD